MNSQWGGINWPNDSDTLMNHLARFNGVDHVAICEIGIDEGKTGNRLVEFLKECGVKTVEYYGIDNLSYKAITGKNQEIKFDYTEMNFIHGDKEEIQDLKPLDFALISACQCAECTFQDSVATSKRIKIGGSMAFHNTSLKIQYPNLKSENKWQHYDSGKPLRPLNVVEGILMARNLWEGAWVLLQQTGDELDWGGIRIYQRIA